MEEMKWFQKAHIEWISKGDRNTRYYHLKTNFCRQRNRVLSLLNTFCTWVNSEVEVRELVVSYFKQVFQDDSDDVANLCTESNFPGSDLTRMAELEDAPSDKEIHDTLELVGPLKALDINGFTPNFLPKELGSGKTCSV